MLKKEELPDSPVATAVQLIGNKWELLILRNLLARQRWTDFENGYQSYTPSFPETPYPDVDAPRCGAYRPLRSGG